MYPKQKLMFPCLLLSKASVLLVAISAHFRAHDLQSADPERGTNYLGSQQPQPEYIGLRWLVNSDSWHPISCTSRQILVLSSWPSLRTVLWDSVAYISAKIVICYLEKVNS